MPTATGVSITGSAEVGQILTGNYTYNDADGDLEGTSTFRWLRNGADIGGATLQTYTLAGADEGAMIIFEVTPVATSGVSPGTAEQSAAVGPVGSANTAPTATDVSITGTAEVGQDLTGNYTYNDADGDLEGTSTFRWLRDDSEIIGATLQNYTLVSADEGAMIIFEVTPVAQTGVTPGTAVQSAEAGPVLPTSSVTVMVYDFDGITSPSATHKAEDGEIDVSDAVIAAGTFGARRDAINGWASWGEATTDEYANLEGSDDVRYQGADPGSGDNAAMIFEFYIVEDPADIFQIDVAVELSQGAATDAVYVYLWDYNTNSYLVGNSYGGTSDSVVSFSVAANVEDYVDPGTGQLTVFVVNMDTDDWIQVDDISVSVHSSTLPMLTMAENPASAGMTDPAVGKYPFESGTIVDILATSYAGCDFFSWTGGVTDPDLASTTVLVDGDKTVTANYTLLSSAFLSDTDFDASVDDDDLIFNDAGQDWYESRQDGILGPTFLSLDETDVGGNTNKKAKITGSPDFNTYLSQEFASPQTGTFGVQWDIYMDEIITSTGYTRSGFMFIGDDADGQRGPNSTGGDRFVYMAFEDGSVPGTMDLVVRVPGTEWSSSLIQLNQDQWYTISVVVNVAANTYDIFVDDVLVGENIQTYTSKASVTHISFASWNDGPGSFYVDNVTEAAVPNIPPTATGVSISGTAEVGQELTGNYTYSDADGDLEGDSTFRWLSDGVEISSATGQTYTLVGADEGAMIIFEVTPVADTGASPGTAVQSVAVGPVGAANTAPTATDVSISGTAKVGQELTGNYTYNDVEGDLEGDSTFRWLRNGSEIGGATLQTYTLAGADEGAMIIFEVTPVADTGASPGAALQSAEVGPVVSSGTNTPPTATDVSISGTAEVGQDLTGNYTYNDVEGDLEGDSTFRWLSDGVEIPGATGLTYTLVAADLGAMIIFEVTPVADTGASPGAALQSAEVGPVGAANTAPTATDVSISGTAEVGQELTGNYTYNDVEGDLEGDSTFRWLSDGVEISGATDRSYTLAGADEGAMIIFEVTPVADTGASPGAALQSAEVGPVLPASSVTETVYDFGDGTGVHHAWGTYTDYWSQDLEGQRRASQMSTEVTDVSGQTDAYDRLALSDATGGDSDTNRYINPDEGSGDESTLIVEFNITENLDDIFKIDVLWEGYGDANHHMELYIWNYVEGNWGDGRGKYGENNFMADGSGSTDFFLSGSVTSNVNDYISLSGEITLLIYDDAASEDSFHDYVSITVHSSTLPMLTMAENPASGGMTDPALGKYPFELGTIVDISATSYAGCDFFNWTGGVTDPDLASTTVLVDGDKTVTANYTLLSSAFLSDTDFDASVDDNDLRINDAGQDWYESRQDGAGGPVLLSLDTTDVAGNVSKKAKITGSTSLNTYMSQEFGSPQTGTFGVQWDIYVDDIDTSGGDTRSAFMFIGESSDGQRGPNSANSERFVYMACDVDGSLPGTMDLKVYDSGWSDSLAQLNQDEWYTISVVVDVATSTYNIYVNDVIVGENIQANTSLSSVTDISFASWNDGPGTFYVDNVQEVSLVTVPNCSGLSESAAITLITSAGFFQGPTSTEFDLIIPAGDVTRTMPAGLTQAPSGAYVDLVLSDGPPPNLPNVVGNDEATAVTTIESFGGLGLVANVIYDYDPVWAAGLVASQNPAAGDPVFPGTVVDLVVSLGPEPPGLMADTDFDASVDSDDLRDNVPGRDWYESRGDVPTLLFLDETDIGGNSSKKAGFTGSASGNAYMSQEFKTPQTGVFSIQYEIYVENILDISDPDRTGWTMIGDGGGTSGGPNSTGSERFVLMAFYKDGGGDTGTMELVAREPGQAWMVNPSPRSPQT